LGSIILTVDYAFEHIPTCVNYIFHELLCCMLIQAVEALSSVVDLLERYQHLDVVLGGLESSQLHHLLITNEVRMLHALRFSTHHAVVAQSTVPSSISHSLLMVWSSFVSLGTILHVLHVLHVLHILLVQLTRAVNAWSISYKLTVRFTRMDVKNITELHWRGKFAQHGCRKT
jgi:hypothetical protein